jgi:hypothetical protein
MALNKMTALAPRHGLNGGRTQHRFRGRFHGYVAERRE